MNRKTITAIIIIAFVIAAVVCCFIVFLPKGTDPSSDPSSGADVSGEAGSLSEPESEWDKATLIWKPNTVTEFELRVKPGVEYELVPDDDCGCMFRTDGGETVYVQVQGFNYQSDFVQLLTYFKSKKPEKLLLGKTTQTVITVYDAANTEICSKITDMLCLTTIGTDVETIGSFYSTVMIRAEGKEYIPLDLNEEFSEG